MQIEKTKNRRLLRLKVTIPKMGWDLTIEGGTDHASIDNRGSFTDEENACVDNIVKYTRECSR
jgi:hypothetical protein